MKKMLPEKQHTDHRNESNFQVKREIVKPHEYNSGVNNGLFWFLVLFRFFIFICKNPAIQFLKFEKIYRKKI